MGFQEQFMRRAIELSEQGMNGDFGGPFGAVIVKDGDIVGEGHNRVLAPGIPDPSAHGEVVAIRDAARNLQVAWLEDTEMYTSCEPCPMCLSTSLWAHVPQIYYAATAEDAANIGFDDAEFYKELGIKPSWNMIQMQQFMRDEAWEVMKQWPEKQKHY